MSLLQFVPCVPAPKDSASEFRIYIVTDKAPERCSIKRETEPLPQHSQKRMSANLTAWFERAIKQVLTATTSEAFTTAFDNTFAPHVAVTLNGKHISKDAFKESLAPTELIQSRSVDFQEVVEVPPADSHHHGSIGSFYTVNTVLKLRVLGGPEVTKSHVAFNAIVEVGTTAEKAEHELVTAANIVMASTTVPPHIVNPGGPIHPGGVIQPGGPKIPVGMGPGPVVPPFLPPKSK